MWVPRGEGLPTTPEAQTPGNTPRRHPVDLLTIGGPKARPAASPPSRTLHLGTEKKSPAQPIPRSVPLPELLPKVLRQPLVGAVIGRPPHEAQVEHVDVLPFGRAAAVGLELAEVLQGGGGPALLGEGAVEDDGLFVGELGQEAVEGVFEGRGGYMDGRLDAASDVVFFFRGC